MNTACLRQTPRIPHPRSNTSTCVPHRPKTRSPRQEVDARTCRVQQQRPHPQLVLTTSTPASSQSAVSTGLGWGGCRRAPGGLARLGRGQVKVGGPSLNGDRTRLGAGRSHGGRGASTMWTGRFHGVGGALPWWAGPKWAGAACTPEDGHGLASLRPGARAGHLSVGAPGGWPWTSGRSAAGRSWSGPSRGEKQRLLKQRLATWPLNPDKHRFSRTFSKRTAYKVVSNISQRF